MNRWPVHVMNSMSEPQFAHSYGKLVSTWADRVDRALTWGLRPDERDDLLRERRADRCDHLSDPESSLTAVVVRSLRSAVSDVRYGFLGGGVSALPLAFVFAIVGIGAISDIITSHLPPALLVFDALAGIGFVAIAFAGFRRPWALDRWWLVPGLALASVGTLGGAIGLPVGSSLEFFDWTNKAALMGMAVGLAVVAVALALRSTTRTWFLRGGMIIWGSALVFAVGQAIWAVVGVPVYSTRASSLMVAIGCLLGAASLGRLRNIAIVS